MKATRGWTGAIALGCALGAAAPARAQVVTDTNQIRGTIRLTNVNPDILAVLDPPADLGFRNGMAEARSADSQASSSATLLDRRSASYVLTVEATPAGRAYSVGARMRLEPGSRKTYVFDAVPAAPVFPEPAPDVTLDLASCAGLLDIRFVTAAGAPATVSSAGFSLWRTIAGGSGRRTILEQGGSGGPASQQYLAYPGSDAPVLLEVTFSVGTDPFLDRIVMEVQREVAARCDEIVPVIVEVPDPSSDLGRIVGRVDVLGEQENLVDDGFGAPYSTVVTASNGPFGNGRSATIAATPSSGSYVLPNLLPSAAVDPPRAYQVGARVSLRGGRRHAWLTMPSLRDANAVTVRPGEEVDVGDALVVDPGFFRGPVVIRGPDPAIEPRRPALAALVRDSDFDVDGDGVPDRGETRSDVHASGVDEIAPGGTHAAAWGSVAAEFDGAFDPATGTFSGSHEIPVGGLFREPSYWSPSTLHVGIEDTSTPGDPRTYVDCIAGIMPRDQVPLLVTPGAVLDVPFRCCLSRLEVTFASTGTPFFAPSLSCSSCGFAGVDAFGATVDQSLHVSGSGTPLTAAEAADRGLVVLMVPQGTLELAPTLRTLNPGGGTSWSGIL